ncbi:MAG: TolC family protein [Chitinophagales bacterium]
MRGRMPGVVVIAFLLSLAAGVVQAAAPLTLPEVLAIARAQSAAVALADLDLEEARLAYEEGKADLVLHPSVTVQQQAESAWKAAQARRELARRDLDMQVQQAYYDVLRTQMAEDLAQRALKQAQAQLATTRVRHAQGMLSDVDLLTSESQLATSEADLSRAQANRSNARMQLNRLMGRDLEAPFELTDEFAYEPLQVDLDRALASAEERRLELQRARDTLALREKELSVSDPAFTPALAVQKARLAVERAKTELAEIRTSILLEVRQNYQAVKEGEARIPILQKNLARAKESLRITEARYNVGVITLTDLIEAQKTAFQAETQVIQAVFDYNMALARFFKSAGGSTPDSR